MKAYKIAFAVPILTVLIVTSAYVIVMTRNIPVSSSFWLFNWNPPPAKNVIPLALAYPETFIMSFPNGTLAMADMLLTFNGELTENTLVHVENASCQVPPQSHVSSIAVGFEEAFLPNVTTNIQQGFTWGGGAVCVVFSRTQQSLTNAWANLTIFWENNVAFPVAGDYPPSVFITFDDSSSPIQYTYSQIRIHVLSASEVNAENTNKLNLGLTFAILGFSFIEGFMVIYELLKNDKTKIQSVQTPTTTTPPIANLLPTKNMPNDTESANDPPTCASEGEEDRRKSNSESKTRKKSSQKKDQP